MADYDLTTNVGAQPAEAVPTVVKFTKVVDFAEHNLAQNDTAQVLDLPAGILVLACAVKVITPEGGTATIDLGLTGGNVDEYIDGADINAAAGSVTKSGDAATDEPIAFANNCKYLTSAETVSILANNALDAAKIVVMVIAVDLRDYTAA